MIQSKVQKSCFYFDYLFVLPNIKSRFTWLLLVFQQVHIRGQLTSDKVTNRLKKIFIAKKVLKSLGQY